MARTLRRLRDRYEYYWVLRDRECLGAKLLLDPRSKKGRKAQALFHSEGSYHGTRAALVPQGVGSPDSHQQ